MMDRLRSRLFGFATALAVIVFVTVGTLVLLAPHYEWAHRWRSRVAVQVWRCANYAAFVLHRDRHCPFAGVWSGMVPLRDTDEWPRAVRSVRVLRRERDLEEVTTPAGMFWAPNGEEWAIAEELHEQAQGEYGGNVRGVHAGDVVLDCGASVGLFTRHALRSGASIVVAIEPAPWSLECLRRNFAVEIGQGRVVIVPKGVWDRDDKLELTVAKERSASAATVVLGHGTRLGAVVPLTTIDHIVEELKLSRVDLIKMDIEGAEPNALRGAVQTVARFRPRLAISLEHRPSDPDTIPALTRELWPDYQEECGPCRNVDNRFQPTVMFARSSQAAKVH
jgi:FkbM family methyltransferase